MDNNEWLKLGSAGDGTKDRDWVFVGCKAVGSLTTKIDRLAIRSAFLIATLLLLNAQPV
jgi:hypothetical protein